MSHLLEAKEQCQRQEMTDAIQDVLTTNVHESCYSCQRIEED